MFYKIGIYNSSKAKKLDTEQIGCFSEFGRPGSMKFGNSVLTKRSEKMLLILGSLSRENVFSL